MKVVKILWEDSCNSNLNWVIKEDVEVELVNIDSFGVVVKETDEFVSIAQNYGSEPEQFSNIVTIPRGCIKEIFVIHDDSQLNEKQKPTDEEMIALLRTEYEKGRADAIAEMQKPAWSEEDKKMLEYALDMIEWYSGENEDKSRLVSDWLKSLKDRVQPQQEWKPNEEYKEAVQLVYDEKLIPFKDGNQWCFLLGYNIQEGVCGFGDSILEAALEFYKEYTTTRECIGELSRPQSYFSLWKPSDEQMEQLGWVAEQNKDNIIGKELMALYKDLKKLREE